MIILFVPTWTFFLISLFFTQSSSLKCWECHSAGSLHLCQRIGVEVKCSRDQVCMTEVREENKQTFIHQSCKQFYACLRQQEIGKNNCKTYNIGLELSLCYSCCWNKDFCNRDPVMATTAIGPLTVTERTEQITTTTNLQETSEATKSSAVVGGLLILNF